MEQSEKKKISILIPAFNEENNIVNLLEDIQKQKLQGEFCSVFEISRIIVISDASTDRTKQIVEGLAANDDRIFLISNQKRLGKTFSLREALKIIATDYAVFFDADVRLGENTLNALLEPLQDKGYDLIGGNPVPLPLKNTWGIAENASRFSWFAIQAIKKIKPNSIYSSHGRILLLSRDLYERVDIGKFSAPGDDQYIYLKSDHNFFYAKEAVVFYKLPSSAKDYLSQNVRFRVAKLTRTKSFFGKELIKQEFKIKNKPILFLKVALRHPYAAFSWFFLYALGYLKFQFYARYHGERQRIWQEVRSTK